MAMYRVWSTPFRAIAPNGHSVFEISMTPRAKGITVVWGRKTSAARSFLRLDQSSPCALHCITTATKTLWVIRPRLTLTHGKHSRIDVRTHTERRMPGDDKKTCAVDSAVHRLLNWFSCDLMVPINSIIICISRVGAMRLEYVCWGYLTVWREDDARWPRCH